MGVLGLLRLLRRLTLRLRLLVMLLVMLRLRAKGYICADEIES